MPISYLVPFVSRPKMGVLWVTASVLALGGTGMSSGPALAANFNVGTEQELRDAVAAAAASPDPESTITLTGNVALTAPLSLPNKVVRVNPAGFSMTGLTFTGAAGTFSIDGVGVIPLVGSSSTGFFNVRVGEALVAGGAKVNAVSETNVSSGGTLTVDGVGSLLTTGGLGAANGSGATILIQNGGVVRTTATHGTGLAPTSTLDLQVLGDGSRLEFGASTTFAASGGASNASWMISGGGAATVAQTLTMGSQATAQATAPRLTVTGDGSTLGLGALVFYRGALSVLDNGDVTVGNLTLGPRLNNGSATLLVSGAGSRVVAAGAVVAGVSAGPGVVTLADEGVLEARGAVTLGSTATSVGVLNIGGGEGVAAASAGALEAATLTLGAAGRLNFNHTGTDYEFAPAIAGGGTINQVAGLTHLTGDSAGFAGTTAISGGTLEIDGRLGGAINVTAGGRLGGSGTIGGDVTVTGGAIAPGNSPGTLTIAGDLSLDAASTLDLEFGESNVVGGPMNDLIKVGGDLTLDGTVDVTVTAGGTFEPGLYRIITYGGALNDQGLAIGTTPAGATTLVQTSIPGQVNLINTGGLPINFWDGDAAGNSGNNQVDGGSGNWTGAGLNWTTETGAVNSVFGLDQFLIFAGAPGAVNVGTVNINSGNLQFAVDDYRLTGGSITISGANRVFRVGDGTADGKDFVTTIDSPILGNNSAGISKTDLGTLILNGANTYGWITQVTAGTLIVNGTMASGANGTIVNVNGTVGGTGRIRGGNFNGTIAPGDLAAAGTLTVAGMVTMGASSKLQFQLGQAGTAGGARNDLLEVTGALTLDGTLNVTQSPGGSFTQGVYRLINYGGSLTNNGLDIGSLPTGFTGVIETSIANQVNLIATGGPPAGGGGGGSGGETEPPPPPPTFNFWDGDGLADGTISGGDGTWRASPTNWTTSNGSINGAFSNAAFAIFAGVAGRVTVDGSDGPIAVSGMQFASDGYRLTGDAVILSAGDNLVRVGDGTSEGAEFVATVASPLIGEGALDKDDEGALILTGENTYSGGTRISAGLLQIGDGGQTGLIQGDVLNLGALAFDRSDEVSFGGIITGGGALAQLGSGMLSLTGDSSAFAGTTRVQAGVLAVDGKLGGVTNVLSGARLIGAGELGGLVNHAGGAVAPGREGVGTLTVTGDYVGAGGVLEMDATLAGDDAPADRLVVRGAVSGVTPVKINRLAGGSGALTTDGVLLVQAGGSAPGAFVLAEGDYRRGDENVLVAGAYGYVLRRDAAGGDWRLRSDLEASEISGTPTGAAAALYQPGVPVYEAYPQALQLLNGLGTMRERTGARQWSGEPGVGVWGRLEGGHTRLRPDISTTGAELKADRWKLQFGAEPLAADDGAGGVVSGGLTAYLGGAKTKIASPYGGGDIDTKGYGVGANLTWITAGGGYVDAQAQASWFDSDLSSSLLGRRADGIEGDGLAASLEAGRGFEAGGLRLTPQAQLSYAKADFDSFTDAFGAVVANDKSESLIGRAGVAVDYSLASGGGVYAVADVSHEFLDGVAIDVSGVPVVSRAERTWAGLSAGGTYAWGEGRYVLYGEVSGDTSLSGLGDSYDITGTTGFRVRF